MTLLFGASGWFTLLLVAMAFITSDQAVVLLAGVAGFCLGFPITGLLLFAPGSTDGLREHLYQLQVKRYQRSNQIRRLIDELRVAKKQLQRATALHALKRRYCSVSPQVAQRLE
jgi:hypothetical protein